MIRRTSAYATLALLLLTLVWLAVPAQMDVQPSTISTPTATPALPVCVVEDGSGQALCMWDADTMGNGEGMSVVSGDCALDITGNEDTQAVCVNVHHNGVKGSDGVQECNDERHSQNGKNGWSLIECYRAFI